MLVRSVGLTIDCMAPIEQVPLTLPQIFSCPDPGSDSDSELFNTAMLHLVELQQSLAQLVAYVMCDMVNVCRFDSCFNIFSPDGSVGVAPVHHNAHPILEGKLGEIAHA